MNKTVIKILLDAAMATVLILLYESHAVNMAFHEVAGLFLFGLFIVHCLLNRKWISTITKKFFNKSLAPKTRFGYVINLLLAISFVFIIISGIRTSQVLLPALADGKDSPWRNVHHFFAALSIILVGIHIGIHWNFVAQTIKKAIKVSWKLAKPISSGILVVILVFGIYRIGTSSFIAWLTTPFISMAFNNQRILSESNNSTATEVKEETGNTEEHTEKSGESKGNSTNAATALTENEADGDATVHPANEAKITEGSIEAVTQTVATFLSIIVVFSAMTYYIDKWVFKKKEKGETVREPN